MTGELACALLDEAGLEHSAGFSVGGVSARLTAARCSDASLDPVLAPFSMDTAIPDIKIQIDRVSALAPTFGPELFDSGSLWRLYEDDAGFRFDFTAAIFGDSPYKRLLVDRRFRKATVQMREESSSLNARVAFRLPARRVAHYAPPHARARDRAPRSRHRRSRWREQLIRWTFRRWQEHDRAPVVFACTK